MALGVSLKLSGAEMYTLILILVISGETPVMASVDGFQSEVACFQAARSVQSQYPRNIYTICVSKGEKESWWRYWRR